MILALQTTRLSLDVSVMNMSRSALHLSWNHTVPLPVSLANVDKPQASNFMLTIKHGQHTRHVELRSSHFVFSAPEGAPVCEVYNFSVTATYVGATYTGAGCSEPSPVISRMLPSLPNISRMEASIQHTLIKQNGRLMLKTYFEVMVKSDSNDEYLYVYIYLQGFSVFCFFF